MFYAFRKMKFLERRVWLRRVFGRLSYRVFFALDRVGLHLLPKHYYTPVADYSWLRKNPEAWMDRTNLACVHWALDEQLDWLRKICEPHHHEVGGLDWYYEISFGGWGCGVTAPSMRRYCTASLDTTPQQQSSKSAVVSLQHAFFEPPA